VPQSVSPVAAHALPPDFAAAHRAVLADQSTQFSLAGPPKIEIPEWLKALKPLLEFLEWIAPAAKYIFWAALALTVALILYYILREFFDLRWPWQQRAGEEREDTWEPDAAPARALLAEADALAASGQFSEAAHLLLLRSVEDIGARKPTLLKPSSTSREIAAMSGLPDKARATFALIARHVEASLFGTEQLDAEGWDACRDAYGRFALAAEWR
jgi:hypothetical protein